MSRAIEISEDEYAVLQTAAAAQNETPERVLGRMIRALASAKGPVYYTTDEMFDALDAYASKANVGEADADE